MKQKASMICRGNQHWHSSKSNDQTTLQHTDQQSGACWMYGGTLRGGDGSASQMIRHNAGAFDHHVKVHLIPAKLAAIQSRQ